MPRYDWRNEPLPVAEIVEEATGQLVECVWVDEEAGEYCAVLTTLTGAYVLNDAGDGLKTEVRRGRVKIAWANKPDEPLVVTA
jgi:hypothetical protein